MCSGCPCRHDAFTPTGRNRRPRRADARDCRSARRRGAAAAQKVSTLTLLSQTAWVGAGGTFSLRLAEPPAQTSNPDELEYAVSVHPASASRSAFTRTLSARPTSSPLAVVTTPVADVTTDEAGAVTLDVGVQDPTLPRDRARVGLRGAGVYPVAVELRSVGGAVHARLLTHLIFQPSAPNGPRLAVGMVVPIRAPLSLQPDGTDRLSQADASEIASVAETLGTVSSSGVLLDPSPETLAALLRGKRPADRAAVAALGPLGLTHPVVHEPFVATQEPEATAADRSLARSRGRALSTQAFGAAPLNGIAVFTDPNDDRITGELPGRVIVNDKLLAPSTQRVTPAEPVAVRRSGTKTTVEGLVADTDLGAHLSNRASPVLAAHHLLADLATIYFDSPGRTRSIVVVPPPAWEPTAAVLGPLLAGLSSSPILEGASIERLFQTLTSSTTRTRLLNSPPSPPRPPAGYAGMRRTITSLTTMMVDSPEVRNSFRDRLLISQAASFSASERASYVAGLERAIRDERNKFLLPNGGALTLTARRGGIPITVRSTAGYDARVLLQVASDRLRFPGGATKELTLSRHDTTTRFTVQTQGSGAIPLRILLKTPDGRVILEQSRLTIRSTNVSGVGIGLSVGALLFLLIWWRRHHKRRRAAPA